MKRFIQYILKTAIFIGLGVITLVFLNSPKYPLAGLGWLTVVVCVVIVLSLFAICRKYLDKSKSLKAKVPLLKQKISKKRVALQLGLVIFYLYLVMWVLTHLGNSVVGDFMKGELPWGG